MIKHDPDNYYEYTTSSSMIVCGECLDEALAATRRGELEGCEVYQGMFKRMEDDHVEAYQCDGCLKQNAPYEEIGGEP